MISLPYVDDEPSLLESGNIDAIISDYQMPGTDGIEFLKKIRASGNNIPFILFTGKGREEVVIEAINNGVDFYLQKGGEPKAQFSELGHKIRQAVRRKNAEDYLRTAFEKNQGLMDNANDAIFVTDLETGMLLDANRKVLELTQFSLEEIKTLHYGDLSPP